MAAGARRRARETGAVEITGAGQVGGDGALLGPQSQNSSSHGHRNAAQRHHTDSPVSGGGHAPILARPAAARGAGYIRLLASARPDRALVLAGSRRRAWLYAVTAS